MRLKRHLSLLLMINGFSCKSLATKVPCLFSLHYAVTFVVFFSTFQGLAVNCLLPL
uniref:Uncharacterized protein n=1 Tax=Arundo donax TaxID=35708 RepID=A0A0A9EG45_ARUDO